MRAIAEPEDYGIVDPLKEADDARLQAWDDFVAWVRDECHLGHLAWVFYRMAEAALIEWDNTPTENVEARGRIREFAEEHGWPDTLRAIAAAMQADERHKRELMDRR